MSLEAEQALRDVRGILSDALGGEADERSAVEWATVARNQIVALRGDVADLRAADGRDPFAADDAGLEIAAGLSACLATLDALGVPLEGSLAERLAWVRGRGLRGAP